MTKQVLEDFISYWRNNQDVVKIYNEFSFQFELGIYLRCKKGYIVEFERNIKDKDVLDLPKKTKLVKKEIDLVIRNNNGKKFAIELKYPRNGQYPEQMYEFVRDIKFMEEAKSNGFNETYTITLVDNPSFYKEGNRKANNNIYSYFRESQGKKPRPINGKIYKPTGKGKGQKYYDISNSYDITWEKLPNDIDKRYYILEIK